MKKQKHAISFLTACGWLWVALVVFSLGFFPLRTSTDEWWHLKTGKWIVEEEYHPGKSFLIPAKDVFTYTAEDYDWDNHEWLSQVGMYLLYRWGEERKIGGWRSLILLKTGILLAAYLLLGRFMWQRAGEGARGAAIAIFLTVLAAALGKRFFWPRPPIISNFFFVFFMYVLWLHRSGRLRTPWLFVLPLLMPLWANLHGGFLLGGIAVAAYCAGEAIEWAGGRWIARRETEELRPVALRFRIYMVIGILCALGSLLNPFGYKVYLLSSRVMSSERLVEAIGELDPPDFRFTWAYGFLIALVGAGLCVLLIRAIGGKKPQWPPAADVLLVLFFFWQSIHHLRHLMLFGLVAAPLMAWMLGRWASNLEEGGRFRHYLFPLVPSICTLIMGLWLVFLPGEGIGVIQGGRDYYSQQFARNLRVWKGQEIDKLAYPTQVASFILSADLPGRMFNLDNYAGYLIWALSPEHYRLFTDSRFDIFGEDFLLDEFSIADGYTAEDINNYYEKDPDPFPGYRAWTEVVKEYKINWLLLPKSEVDNSNGRITISNNQKLLHPDSGWALIYVDYGFRIWLKRTPENQPWIEKYEVTDPRLIDAVRKEKVEYKDSEKPQMDTDERSAA